MHCRLHPHIPWPHKAPSANGRKLHILSRLQFPSDRFELLPTPRRPVDRWQHASCIFRNQRRPNLRELELCEPVRTPISHRKQNNDQHHRSPRSALAPSNVESVDIHPEPRRKNRARRAWRFQSEDGMMP